MNIKFLKISIALATCVAISSPGAAAVFNNGSFETQDYTGWELSDDTAVTSAGTWGIATNELIAAGATLFDHNDSVFVAQTSTGLPRTYAPSDGDFMSFLLITAAASHTLKQEVVLPNSVTTIFWDMFYENLGVPFFANQQLLVSLRDASNTLHTLFITDSSEPLAVPNMTAFSADVSAFAGQTVSFEVNLNIRNGFFDAGFDNFRTNLEEPENEVPEPGTLALLGIGLAGLGLVRRRRKSF